MFVVFFEDFYRFFLSFSVLKKTKNKQALLEGFPVEQGCFSFSFGKMKDWEVSLLVQFTNAKRCFMSLQA